jgi:hypothetical protein
MHRARRQRCVGQIAPGQLSSLLETFIRNAHPIVRGDARPDHIQDGDGLLRRGRLDAQHMRMFRDHGVGLEALGVFRLCSAAYDGHFAVEKSFLELPARCLREIGAQTTEKTRDVRHEEDAPTCATQPTLHRNQGIVEQCLLVDHNQTFQPGWPIALRHQKRQAIDERALAHPRCADQYHMAVGLQGEQTDQVAQQALAEVHRCDLTLLRQGDIVRGSGIARRAESAEHILHGVECDAVAFKQARHRDALIGHAHQHVLCAEVNLLARTCQGERFVQHDQELIRKGHPPVIVGNPVEFHIRRHALTRKRGDLLPKTLPAMTAPRDQLLQHPVRICLGALDQGEKQNFRGQHAAPESSQTRRCRIQYTRQLFAHQIGIECTTRPCCTRHLTDDTSCKP